MSKADSSGDFLGRNGDYIYYKVNGELRKRKAPGKSFSKKVKKASEFSEFRQYGKIKGKSSSLGKMIRKSLIGIERGFFDHKTHFRLSGVIHQGMLGDKERFMSGKPFIFQHAKYLAGFKFHEGMNLSVYFSDPEFVKEDGRNKIKFEFIEEKLSNLYDYIGVSVLVGGYDFNKVEGELLGESSAILHIKNRQSGFSLDLPTIDLNPGLIYLVMLKIEPYQLVNGKYVRLYNRQYQYLEIIDVFKMRSLK
ncbi:hypothetical protein KIH41_05430 [Litoribacter ruber]|uniref:Uncharacterized protein n=1 Tax=Litoribacter ruber TaxID=702568 RepID=A0AAP2CG15_9BACT|nr:MULTISPECIES: hypothetical protein [Litoribacter]MBS9523120.1 hypothetical protein [Litoribacter alkaliphilus]MBT0810717.1 hypothetical protein [Litoribacter ruber]